MGLRINTNLTANNARRHLFNTTITHKQSMEKLSSGLRINRAADDAAGLAISEGLKAENVALMQASRNASNGISLIQTAEGSLDEISSILIRMRELATQSRGGALSRMDRSHLSSEYHTMRLEIDRIASSSEFNGVSLLDGTGGIIPILVGASTNSYDFVDIDLTNEVDSAAFPLNVGIWDSDLAVIAMAQIAKATEYILGLRGNFGALQNRLESTIRNINNTTENISNANSRIRDVDYARETSRIASSKILQQAGIAMLSRAQGVPLMTLELLQ